MTNIDEMNEIFMRANTVAKSGLSLAAQTKRIITDMDDVLAKIAIIKTDREAAGNLHLMIGDAGMAYVEAVTIIMYEASMKVKALEA